MTIDDVDGFDSVFADLNRYGRALNGCESVDEVVSLTIEAASLLLETQVCSVFEAEDGDLRLVAGIGTEGPAGTDPEALARRAIEAGEVVRAADGQDGGPTAEGAPDGDGPTQGAAPDADGSTADEERTGAADVLSVPGHVGSDVTIVVVAGSPSGEPFAAAEAHVLELLAAHSATAVGNIRTHRRLERARSSLERRKEMIEMYDGLLRHDLGNDLQVVLGYAERLTEQLEGDHREEARRIRDAAVRAADLVERVGTIVGTLEDEQTEPEPRALRPVLEQVVADVADRREALTVEFDAEAADHRVYAGELLEAAFDNLLTNAVVHNEGPVRVRVEVEAVGQEAVLVRVADDGAGVPEPVRDGLFEMGVKGPGSDGTGLGLGFVRALVESYGGDVGVTDSEAGGAGFEVRLRRV